MPQLKKLAVDWVSFVDRAAVRDPQNKSEPRRFLLMKREGIEEEIKPQEGGAMPTDVVDAPETAQKEDRADLQKLSAQGSGPPPGDDPSKDADHDGKDMQKKPRSQDSSDDTRDGGVEGDTQKEEKGEISKLRKEYEDIRKRAESAEAMAKVERDLRVTSEFIAKAEEFKALSIDPQTDGPVLKRASEALSKEDFERIEAILRAADEAVAQGDLFKEVGRAGAAERPSDAFGELQKKADEIRKADPKISQGDALAQAMHDNPDIQQRYLAEERGVRR